MLRLLITMYLLFNAACAKIVDPRSTKNQDKAFTAYVRLFESMYGKSTSNVSIGFAELEGSTVGRCKRWSNGFREIEIDPKYWNSKYTSEEEKIGLIFHELGHCELNRSHVEDIQYYSGQYIRGDVPRSLMYPYNFYSSFYSELESYYFAEMFTPNTKISSKQSRSINAPDHGCVIDL